MALYALQIAQGSTMLSATINHTTTNFCLKEASSVSLRHKLLDPLLDTRGLEAQCIKEVLSEVKLWESMPNHKEPVTVKVVLHVHKKFAKKHPDNIESVTYDWIVLGIFYGFRLSEWAQNASDKTQPLTGTDSLPLAFVFLDLTFLGVERTTIPQS